MAALIILKLSFIQFDDQRIVYLKNPNNQGLIYTLNKAIAHANGKYIARMDADDICLQERLAKQKAFLDQNEDITALLPQLNSLMNKKKKQVFGNWTGKPLLQDK